MARRSLFHTLSMFYYYGNSNNKKVKKIKISAFRACVYASPGSVSKIGGTPLKTEVFRGSPVTFRTAPSVIFYSIKRLREILQEPH